VEHATATAVLKFACCDVTARAPTLEGSSRTLPCRDLDGRDGAGISMDTVAAEILKGGATVWWCSARGKETTQEDRGVWLPPRGRSDTTRIERTVSSSP
jgi:hypothetical protein